MIHAYTRLSDGTLVPAIPEPFWERSLRTWFRWKPYCVSHRRLFKDKAEYEEHYVKYHFDDE